MKASHYPPLVYLLQGSLSLAVFLAPSLRAQSQAGNTGKELNQALPPTQASLVSEGFREELSNDARRRLIYYRELVDDGHYERAKSYLENFLIIYPDHPYEFEIKKLLADSYKKNHQTRLAAEAYIEAYASAPEEERGLKAYLDAARILADLGEHKRAQEILKEIIQRRPNSALSRLAERELSSFPLTPSTPEAKSSTEERTQTKPTDASTSESRSEPRPNEATKSNPEKPLLSNETSKKLPRPGSPQENKNVPKRSETKEAANTDRQKQKAPTQEGPDLIGEGIADE